MKEERMEQKNELWRGRRKDGEKQRKGIHERRKNEAKDGRRERK